MAAWSEPLGFTLVELLVMVTLLCVVVAMSVPRVQTVASSWRLTHATTLLREDLRFAQASAVRRARVVVVQRVTSGVGSYELVEYGRPGEKTPGALDWVDPGGLAESGSEWSLVVARDLPRGIQLNFSQARLEFWPDGSSSGGWVGVSPRGGGTNGCRLHIDRALGVVSAERLGGP